jgi:hypothetical protein
MVFREETSSGLFWGEDIKKDLEIVMFLSVVIIERRVQERQCCERGSVYSFDMADGGKGGVCVWKSERFVCSQS